MFMCLAHVCRLQSTKEVWKSIIPVADCWPAAASATCWRLHSRREIATRAFMIMLGCLHALLLATANTELDVNGRAALQHGAAKAQGHTATPHASF